MIENSDDDTEGTFAEFLNYFVSVVNVVVVANVVLLLVRVKAIVSCIVHTAPFNATRHGSFLSFPLQSFLVVEIVNSLEF